MTRRMGEIWWQEALGIALALRQRLVIHAGRLTESDGCHALLFPACNALLPRSRLVGWVPKKSSALLLKGANIFSHTPSQMKANLWMKHDALSVVLTLWDWCIVDGCTTKIGMWTSGVTSGVPPKITKLRSTQKSEIQHKFWTKIALSRQCLGAGDSYLWENPAIMGIMGTRYGPYRQASQDTVLRYPVVIQDSYWTLPV